MKRVIVELKAPIGLTMEVAMDSDLASLPGLELDASYQPIAIAAEAKVAKTLAAGKEEATLVRGLLNEAEEKKLRASSKVINVWTDARIAAFGDCPQANLVNFAAEFPMAFDTSDLMAPFELETASPCPPNDCDSSTARGSILDVAKYLGCDRLWNKGIRGKGMVIGICDTGVNKAKIPAVIDGWTPDSNYPPGTDPGGHGSMCATDALGMCPDAKIFDIGILKSQGDMTGFLSDAVAAFQWAMNRNKKDGTPQVLSNSWGMYRKDWAPDYATDPNHPFTRKVVEAIDMGIIVTFAAGNCGAVCPSGKCGTDNGPGKSIWGANGHPRVITVGAANILEQWIGYSSQGPAALDPKKPDFCAPSHFKGYTSCDNGTSAANPVCAGVAALLKSCDLSLNQDKVKEALQKTAKDLCGAGWDPQSGYGIIQAEAAYSYLFAKPVPLVHAMWIHGTSVHAQNLDDIQSLQRLGFYSLFDGKMGRSTWFHAAIPTPVIVSDVRLKLDSVMLMFVTDPDVTVTNVHVYDGYVLLQAFDNLNMSGQHLFERFTLARRPLVRFGIGVSVGVKFGGRDGGHRIAFISSGGDFV